MWDKVRSSINSLSIPSGGAFSLPRVNISAPSAQKDLPEGAAFTRQSTASEWQHACKSYLALAPHQRTQPTPAAFAGYGSMHLALAELILERRHDITAQGSRRIFHIEHHAHLVAVFDAAKRRIQLRHPASASENSVDAYSLSLRALPATAQWIEGPAARDFHVLPLASLLWYFGQTARQAIEDMPCLHAQLLHVERFPHLEPDALQLRHLQLIHALGQRSMNFEELLLVLPKASRPFICPDLASLYLTGVLSILSAQ